MTSRVKSTAPTHVTPGVDDVKFEKLLLTLTIYACFEMRTLSTMFYDSLRKEYFHYVLQHSAKNFYDVP